MCPWVSGTGTWRGTGGLLRSGCCPRCIGFFLPVLLHHVDETKSVFPIRPAIHLTVRLLLLLVRPSPSLVSISPTNFYPCSPAIYYVLCLFVWLGLFGLISLIFSDFCPSYLSLILTWYKWTKMINPAYLHWTLSISKINHLTKNCLEQNQRKWWR